MTTPQTTVEPPILLADTAEIVSSSDPDATGAVWKLTMAQRDLDANVIAMPADQRIDTHDGPPLDVLVHVLAGTGLVETETGTLPLGPGTLLWLPRQSRRAITAGPEGLRYLTVHKRRQALLLGPTVTVTDR